MEKVFEIEENKMEKVSIVIPVYNAEKYLRECLDSIINQTYENIEIIIINDGSKDSSLNICKEYAKEDSRIKLINQENIGVSKTRNKGIDVATGKYILFVDSDDYCELNMVEIAMKSAQKDELFIWGYTEVHKNKVVPIKYNIEINMNNLYKIFTSTLIGSSCNKIFSVQILRENKLYFEEKIYNCEDLLFVLKYLQFIKSIKYEKHPLYHHRIGRNVIMFFEKPTHRNITILNAYEKMLEIPTLNDELIRKIKYEYIVAYHRIKKFLPKDFEVRYDILNTSKKLIFSKNYSIKEKIRYIVIKYFNEIYKKYYLSKIDVENLFE